MKQKKELFNPFQTIYLHQKKDSTIIWSDKKISDDDIKYEIPLDEVIRIESSTSRSIRG